MRQVDRFLIDQLSDDHKIALVLARDYYRALESVDGSASAYRYVLITWCYLYDVVWPMYFCAIAMARGFSYLEGGRS